jgi:hypothetical protein
MNNYCKICHEYIFSFKAEKHKCAPAWEAFCPDMSSEDDTQKVYSWGDSPAVAEKFLEDNFARYDHPTDCEVWVRKTPGDPWEKFTVEVEAVPSFSASRKP